MASNNPTFGLRFLKGFAETSEASKDQQRESATSENNQTIKQDQENTNWCVSTFKDEFQI